VKESYSSKMDERVKRKRIGWKVGNLVILMLMASMFLVVAVCVFMFYSLIMKSLEQRCVDGTNMLAYEIGRMSDDEDEMEVLDKLKSHMEMEFSVFEGDTRTYTTIYQDGQRAVGTSLSDEMSDIILRQEQSYVGTADILGVKHICSYVPIRDEDGVIVDFKTTGEFPKYGNDDDRVDTIAQDIVHKFMTAIRRHHTYRNGVPTTSILTITSNVTYGKATGNTPDGRKKGQPFAPGANPMHGRDTHGAVASLSSVSKLPFKDAQDGISNTFTIIPGALGKEDQVFAGDLELDLNK